MCELEIIKKLKGLKEKIELESITVEYVQYELRKILESYQSTLILGPEKNNKVNEKTIIEYDNKIEIIRFTELSKDHIRLICGVIDEIIEEAKKFQWSHLTNLPNLS